MTNEAIHKDFGTPLGEWIELIPGELDLDAVGLWQIVGAGRRGFGLEGDALRDFVRRGIEALLKAGAVPVTHNPPSEELFWKHLIHYGQGIDEIADNVLAEWEQSGKDPDLSDDNALWFALRDELTIKNSEVAR